MRENDFITKFPVTIVYSTTSIVIMYCFGLNKQVYFSFISRLFFNFTKFKGWSYRLVISGAARKKKGVGGEGGNDVT